tara:strand:+ start:371 stop:547 length:177 start_codon:yes stop_codon:yes gene_type:complete
MEKLLTKNALIVVLSLTVISPLFWSFFEGSLSFIIYLFSLFVIWVYFLYRTAKKIENP